MNSFRVIGREQFPLPPSPPPPGPGTLEETGPDLINYLLIIGKQEIEILGENYFLSNRSKGTVNVPFCNSSITAANICSALTGMGLLKNVRDTKNY